MGGGGGGRGGVEAQKTEKNRKNREILVQNLKFAVVFGFLGCNPPEYKGIFHHY